MWWSFNGESWKEHYKGATYNLFGDYCFKSCFAWPWLSEMLFCLNASVFNKFAMVLWFKIIQVGYSRDVNRKKCRYKWTVSFFFLLCVINNINLNSIFMRFNRSLCCLHHWDVIMVLFTGSLIQKHCKIMDGSTSIPASLSVTSCVGIIHLARTQNFPKN